MDEQEQERQFAALWEDAVQIFYKTADKHLLRENSLPDPLTVEDLIAQIDKEQQSFTAYREHKRRLYDTLGTVLGPVSLLGKIAAGTASIVSHERPLDWPPWSCRLSRDINSTDITSLGFPTQHPSLQRLQLYNRMCRECLQCI